MIKSLSLGATLVTILAGAAQAADMPLKAPPVPIAVYNWTGFYVGINGGYGFSARDEDVVWNETFATTPFFGPASAGSLNPAGAFGGVQVGYNQQLGSLVVGIEADLQGAGISDSATGVTTPYLAPGGVASMTSKNSVGWFGTVRPRLGFAWDRTLLYATGGLAWGGITHEMQWSDNFGFSTPQDRVSSSQVGYVLGGGIEYGFSHNLRLKLEYQYLDFGTTHYKAPELFGPGGAATAFAINTDTHTDFHTVRVGLNWKWDERREAPLK